MHTTPWRSRRAPARLVVATAAVVLAVIAGACSSTASSSSTSSSSSSTAGAAGTTAAASTSGTTRATGTSVLVTGAGTTAISIEVDDPTAGHLVFDAIAAGDPARAKEGKLVLLLHGFPETSDAWSEQLQPLADAGYYAVAPNQRGYSSGARPAGIDRYALPSLIADVFAMATALGADSFHLVGHDWGAAVAWVAAAANPTRVRSLMTFSVPHPDAFADAFTNADGEQTRKSGYINVFQAEGSEDRLLENDAAGLRIVYGSQVPAEKIEAYRRVLGTPEALGAALNWYRATNLKGGPRLGKVQVPTTFVWSTNDVAIARSGAEATKDFVDAPYRFEVLDGISHWIPEEVPDRTRDLLLEHLASVP